MDFYHSEKIIRLTPINDLTIATADNIVNNVIKVFPTLPDVIIESTDSLWELVHTKSDSTYTLYSYALYPVSYLLNAYEKTKKILYLEKALEFTKSFLRWLDKKDKIISNKKRKILFGDHAVSNRTQVICYLLICFFNEYNKIPEYLISSLLSNGHFLADINNYSHYNHGLMMDLALLGLINTFEGLNINYPKIFKKNLRERLDVSLDRDISFDGVHIENSPGYHFWILKFLEKIKSPLLNFDKTLYKRCSAALDNSKTYADYITRSDNSIPMIGDTHSNLKRRAPRGLTSRYFKGADIVIFRDKVSDFWMFFSSGYKTHIHKHEDNGAINVFYNGEDILFDPGFLNYESDSLSLDIKSTPFHNTVSPNKLSQKIIKKDISIHDVTKENSNLSDSKIISFFKQDNYEGSLAVISDYEGFNIMRMIVVIDHSNIFILDYVKETYDKELKNITQYYNINSNFSLKKISDLDCVELTSEKNKCLVKSYDCNDHKNITYTLSEAYHAVGFNKLKSNSRLCVESKSDCLLTQIALNGELKTIQNGSIILSDKNMINIYELFDRVQNPEFLVLDQSKKKQSKKDIVEAKMRDVYQHYLHEVENKPYLPNPYKILHINPLAITHVCSINEITKKKRVYKELDFWTFYGGDWHKDSRSILIESTGIIDSVRMRVYEDIPWNKTPIFFNKLKAMKRNGSVDSCRTIKELEDLYILRDNLLLNMRDRGFKEIKIINGVPDLMNALSVSIGPLGEYYLGTGGLHRLAFAQFLGLEKIPVLVLTRHKQWLDKIKKYYMDEGSILFKNFMSQHEDIITK